MLSKVTELKGYALQCSDGDIGKVEEFYFDDRYWTIRYLIVNTGNWLPGRQVLVSPHALMGMDTAKRQIAVNLTRQQIEAGPSLDTDKPVSRQFETAYFRYYGWPNYWDGSNVWGFYPVIAHDPEARRERDPSDQAWDPNLRSTRAVSGYRIEAEDGTIGHVEDFIVDSESWTIRYLVIDTRNWWPGRNVVIAPRWIERVSWSESKVFVQLSREAIRQAPEYADGLMLSREYEERLHGHYRRPGYWSEEPPP
jgi:uncharacterized protein YrrD